MGRLTSDPEIRYSNGEEQIAIGRYRLAVNRRSSKQGEQEADFISCIAFGRAAEFADKYFRKGMQVLITGRIQTGSYTNREGIRVYTTDVVIEDQEFADSKRSNNGSSPEPATDASEFMDIPDGIDSELPFN